MSVVINQRKKSEMSSLPSASKVELSASASSSSDEVMSLEEIIMGLKTMETMDLIKTMKLAANEIEKRLKTAPSKVKKEKKAGSMPKGVVPKQLRKPRAWVEFVLEHGRMNGWEEFTVQQSNKDTKEVEIIEMEGSMEHNGGFVFVGSVTEKCPDGRGLLHKDAMSLSRHYWTPKTNSGTRPELYAEFEDGYEEDEVDEEMEMKKEEKKRDEEEKKLQKGRELAEKKAKKMMEEQAKKAPIKVSALKESKGISKVEKEEKEEKVEKVEKEEKVAEAEKVVEASKVEREIAPSVLLSVITPTKSMESKVPAAPLKAKRIVKKVPEWSCPDDGDIHDWEYKGKVYSRTYNNYVWEQDGKFMGVYNAKEDVFDTSVEDPLKE